MTLLLRCAECGQKVEFEGVGACENGHPVRTVCGIPQIVSQASYESKITADPMYKLEHANKVAALLGERATLREAIDLFFEIREQELGQSLNREKALFVNRQVPHVSETISRASLMMAKHRLTFPDRGTTHIEIGSGLGFDLAASARSYFGNNTIGIDLSPHYLVMSRMLFKEQGLESPKLICADIVDGWPIPLDSYNIGFISLEGVLEHIKNVDSLFTSIKRIKSYPFAMFLTVPYRWTIHPESHFNLRGVGWLPTRKIQDTYVKWRLRHSALDHVEQYSRSSLRRVLERYFARESVFVERNHASPLKAHYLCAMVYVRGEHDLMLN